MQVNGHRRFFCHGVPTSNGLGLTDDAWQDRGQRVRLIRFGVVGLTGILVNLLMLFVLVDLAHLSFYLAAFLAIEISIITNYLLNDIWTWSSERSGNFFVRFIHYHVSTAFSSICVTLIALQLFKEWIGLPYLLAGFLAIGTGMLAKLLMAAFRPHDEPGIQLPRTVMGILALSLLVRLLIAATTGPGFDEAYYYAYSIRPSLSYFDHPPIVGFLAGFFPYLFDYASAFTVRLAAILLFTASGVFFYRFVRGILDEKSSQYAYLFFNVIPLFFLLAGSVIIPDTGLVFFWILALFPLRRIFYGQAGWQSWLLAGLLTGFSMLSKYHGILLGFSLLVTLIFLRPRDFLKPGPYLYAFSALIPILPVIIWNIQHDFVSFTFQGNRAIGTTLSMRYFLQALGGQAAYLTPMALVPFLVVIWNSFYRGLVQKHRDQQFYFLFGSLHVLFFLLLSLFTPVLPHWTLPGYIVLLVPFTVMIRSGLEKRLWVRYTYRISMVLVLLLLILVYGHTRWGILSNSKNAGMDVSLDLYGWESIPAYLEEQGLGGEEYFLFSYKWFLCGEIELSTRGEYPVLCFNQHDPRGYGIWDQELDLVGQDGIFICSDRYFQDPGDTMGEYFQSVSPADSVVVTRVGDPVKTIYFYRCNKLLKPYPTRF